MNSSQAMPRVVSRPVPITTAVALRRWNIALGTFHGVQAVGIVVLATAFALPVTASFLAGPPGTPAAPPTTLLEVPLA